MSAVLLAERADVDRLVIWPVDSVTEWTLADDGFLIVRRDQDWGRVQVYDLESRQMVGLRYANLAEAMIDVLNYYMVDVSEPGVPT